MSGWRDAPELDKDYEARPANGWDLRADAWLPAWPQLGGKLAYEQYYGDEVALFGTDNRQKDPHAFTVGLNYTPFPLLTFSAEQRQGKGGENDTRLGVGLTWQPDVAWQKQTDPDAVGSRRSLAGSRHDLVERNNSIVLEYRKKTLVKLRLNDPVKGKPVVASLQTKYALKGYTVEAPGITVAGGKVETPPGQVVVTLPAYRYTQTPETDNVYRVSVVAEDVKGNRSERADASVVVTEPELTAATSEVKADRSSVTANGVDRVTLTYHARDVNGYEVQGLKLTTRTEGVKDVTLSEWKDNGDGSYTQEVTAGRTTGTVSLMPQVKGSDAAKDAVQLTLTAGDMVADKSTVSVQPASIKADGAEATTVTYQARDAHGNLVPLQATDVTLSVSGVEATTFSGFTESVPGVYVGTLTGTRTGTASLMPQVNGSDAAKDAAQLTLTAGAPYANSSTVTLAATSLTVGDTHTTTATWTVKDEHNNPVTGLTDATLNVTSQTEGVTVTATAWAEDINSPGTYTATVTAGDKAGTVRLMPQVNGSDAAKDAAQLMLTAGAPVSNTSSISTNKTGYTVGESMTVTVMLKDAQGNPVSDKESDLASAVTVPNASLAGDWAEAPGTSGTYTATYTATGAGEDLKAELMLSGWTVAKKADSAYTITEPQPRAMTGTITANGKSDFSTTATTKFPTTGFKGAYFTLNDDNFQGGVGNYTLKASCGSDPNECDWVSVDNDGKVTFDGDATTAKKTVTITAMPKNGGDPLTYKFTVSRWFTNQGPSGRNWTDTNEACTTAGLALPPPEDLSGEYGVKPKRVIGSLWGEWGDFSNWRAQGWSIGLPYWTAVARSQDAYFYVYLTDGAVGYNLVTVTATYGVCVRGL